MTGWGIVIPSARRAEVLARRTLPFLDRAEIEPERVSIFVPDLVDLTAYRFALPARWRKRLMILPHTPEHSGLDDLGIKPHGLGAVRNAILDLYSPGERIVQMDDDLDGLLLRIDEKRAERIDDRLEEIIDTGFGAMDQAGSALWGIYPVRNPYFMRDRIRTDLTYICGGLFGIEVRGEEWERVVLDDKEDFERSLRYYVALGSVVRLEYVAIVTQGYAGAGGMQASRSALRVDRASRWLVDEFPGLCSLNLSKKSGWAEVRLKDRR